MSDTAPPAAGWYADPENPAGERWWNGSGWSDHKRDAPTEVAQAAATEYSAPDPAPVVAPAVAPYTVPEPAGFTYGNPNATPRPDPYAPPVAQSAGQPYYTAAPSSPYVAPYGAPAPGQGVNGLALAGLLVAAIGWLIAGALAGIAGLVMSILGLREAKKREATGHPQPGRGLAMGGIIVSSIVLALSVVFFIVYIGFFVSSFTSTY